VRAPTDEGRSSAHEDLNFQRADESLGPKRGIGNNNLFCRCRFAPGHGTYSVQMNIYDRAAENKKKVGWRNNNSRSVVICAVLERALATEARSNASAA
jgi:hypothetical protein